MIASSNLKEMERVKIEFKYPDRILIMEIDLNKPKEC